MTNREAVENNNVLIFEAEDVNDPTWEVIISTLKEHIPGFNVGYGDGNWMAFAVPNECRGSETRIFKRRHDMNREQIEDMAQQLLNITFYIYEWDEDFLNEQVKEVADQIEALKRIKEKRSMFDLTIDLFDLLAEAYNCDHFESY